MLVFEVAPIYLKKEKRVRKEGPLMKKKIIRIGTKRKPKLKSGEKVKPLQLTKQVAIAGTQKK